MERFRITVWDYKDGKGTMNDYGPGYTANDVALITKGFPLDTELTKDSAIRYYTRKNGTRMYVVEAE